MFAELVMQYDAGEIPVVERLNKIKPRTAAQHFAEGRFEDGMHILHEEGRLNWSGTDDEARDALGHAFDVVRHCYSGSVCKSQGASISRMLLHHTRDWKDASGYIAMSRQKGPATVFVSREAATDWRDIARQLRRTMLTATAVSVGVSPERHVAQPIQGILTRDAERLVAVLKSPTGKSNQDSPGPTVLGDSRIEWRDRKLSAKGRMKERLFSRFLQERKDADRTAKAAITEVRGRHRAVIDAAMHNRPKAQDFDAWLASRAAVGDQEAHAHRDWRQATQDRQAEHHLARPVDLCEVLADGDWIRDGEGRSQQVWRHPADGRRILVQTDSDGSGTRWLHPGRGRSGFGD